MATETVNDWVIGVGLDTSAVDRGAKRIEKTMKRLQRLQGKTQSSSTRRESKLVSDKTKLLNKQKVAAREQDKRLKFQRKIIVQQTKLEKLQKSGRVETLRQKRQMAVAQGRLRQARQSGSSIEFSKFNNSMARLNKSINKNTTAQRRRPMGTVGAALSGAASIATVSGVSSNAQSRERTRLKFQGAFGENADRELKYIQGFSDKFGLDFTSMSDSLVRFSDTIDAPIARIKALTETVGILGKAKGLNHQQLDTLSRVISQTGAIGSMETEDARSLLESGVGVKKILKAGGFEGNLLDRARNQDISANEFFDALLKGVEATGARDIASKASSNTEAGLTRISNAFSNFSDALVKVWEPVIVPVLNGMANILNFIAKTINGDLGLLAQGMAVFASSIAVIGAPLAILTKAFTVLIGPLKSVSKLGTSIGNMFTKMGTALSTLGTRLMGLLAVFARATGKKVATVAAGVVARSPLGAAAIGGAVVGTGINRGLAMSETGRNINDSIGEQVNNILAFFGNDNAQLNQKMLSNLNNVNAGGSATVTNNLETTIHITDTGLSESDVGNIVVDRITDVFASNASLAR